MQRVYSDVACEECPEQSMLIYFKLLLATKDVKYINSASQW